MKTIVTSALSAIALTGSFGLADSAVAAPAHSAVVVAHFDDSHGHNDVDLDNDDPVTDQGANLGTRPLGTAEKLADGEDSDDSDDSGDDTSVDPQTPTRPGGNTHFSRNGVEHANPDSGESDDSGDDTSVAPQTPARPGGNTHFSRNGTVLDNTGHPVTGQGPNKVTKTLKDTLNTAGR